MPQGSHRLKVGVVGAGVCGLASARYLYNRGHEVVVFERSHSVGGRVADRHEGGFLWDTGASSIAPRGKAIEHVLLNELSTDGLIKVAKPIYVHSGLRVSPGHPGGADRYTYSRGTKVFAERLADRLDVRLGRSVDTIEKAGNRYLALDEEFDALILTPPVPQSSLLLWNLGDARPVSNVHYRSCISVLLGYNTPLPETSYHALLDPEQVHPMTWLCLESVKSSGRAPAGGAALTVQMSAAYSVAHYEMEDEALVQIVVGFIMRLYGPTFQTPQAWGVVRWKYSQPESFATYEKVNPPGSKLIVASDGLIGGHIEDAFEVGTRAAQQLVEEG